MKLIDPRGNELEIAWDNGHALDIAARSIDPGTSPIWLSAGPREAVALRNWLIMTTGRTW